MDNEISEPAAEGSPKAKAMTRAAIRHAVPFFLWIGIMLLAGMMHLTPGSGTEETPSLNLVSDALLYAIKTGAVLVALLILRPWRHYAAPSRKNLALGLLVGFGVFGIWVIPETDWFAKICPSLATLYETWCVRPFGELRAADCAAQTAALYAPSATGWPLFAAHLVGTGLVISVAEEFFWRGYLMRTVRTPDFLDIDVGEFHLLSFLAVAALFAAEHTEALAGFLAGLAFAALYLRTRDIWSACLAHATTNLLLGLYVPLTGHWEFW